jgi:hypothetical protein
VYVCRHARSLSVDTCPAACAIRRPEALRKATVTCTALGLLCACTPTLPNQRMPGRAGVHVVGLDPDATTRVAVPDPELCTASTLRPPSVCE